MAERMGKRIAYCLLGLVLVCALVLQEKSLVDVVSIKVKNRSRNRGYYTSTVL